ncbi:hypothetical protein [Stappia sp. WLB 29]|uniref:endonuclease/exonuclease/phosphatase family protein n=1 Tax=Stappia sp. WLB 29 TaxID=2925220 RepID=UPI0020BDBDA9|nr:hypothetical protein [Stappia sp. WLB 29]
MLKRGKDFLTVGFWNIEKHYQITANPDVPFGFVMSASTEFVVETIVNWYRSHHVDVLVLAEVVDGSGAGDRFMNYLATRLNVVGFPKPFFRAGFRWSETRGGTKSVCNFGFLWNEKVQGLEGLDDKVSWYWERDHTRPTLILPTGVATIGAIHAKASYSSNAAYKQAMKEIFEAAVFIDQQRRPGLLIGDMNVPFEKVPPQEKSYMTDIEWSQVPPNVAPTHVTRGRDEFGRYEGRHEAVLDYAWRNGGLAQCLAENPYPGYQFWDYVDHAPIMYHVARTAQELPVVIIEEKQTASGNAAGLVPGGPRPVPA